MSGGPVKEYANSALLETFIRAEDPGWRRPARLKMDAGRLHVDTLSERSRSEPQKESKRSILDAIGLDLTDLPGEPTHQLAGRRQRGPGEPPLQWKSGSAEEA